METCIGIALRKQQNWKKTIGKREIFITMSLIKVLEYFKSSSKRLDF